MNDNVDVLVVGAGPVGLLLSCELARRGVAFRVVDKLPEPTTESRAIVVHARSLEMLERVGVVDEFISSGVRTTAMEFHAGGKTEAHLSLDTVDSPYPFTVTLAQTETERILTERLRDLGVEVERSTELVGIVQDEKNVEATLRLENGDEAKVECAFVVGTDGSRSTIRHAVGTRLEGSFKGVRFLLADVEAEYDLDWSSMHTIFSPDRGPLLLFPMQGERTRVIAQLPEQALSSEDPTLPETQEIVDGWESGIRLLKAHWLTVFEIHHAQVPQYRYGRAFLAGDSAHVHSPAGGQGMNTGMQDAFNLGWKLAVAIRGDASSVLLDSYNDERHPIAKRVIAQTTKVTEMGTLRRRSEQTIRDHIIHIAAGLAPVRRRMASMTEETDINYRGSHIIENRSIHHEGVRPGDVTPDVPRLHEERSLHSILSESVDHTLLWIVRSRSDLDRNHLEKSAAAFPRPEDARHVVVSSEDITGLPGITPVVDSEGRVAQRYGVKDPGELFIIRPDGYVGMRASLKQEDAPQSYVARLHGQFPYRDM